MKLFLNKKTLKLGGFTLLELLVVVAIIGFLSTVAVVALSVSQAHQRDTQRLLDQATILKGVELYASDNGTVPAQLHAEAPMSNMRFADSRQNRFLSLSSIVRSTLNINTAQAALNPHDFGTGCECPAGYVIKIQIDCDICADPWGCKICADSRNRTVQCSGTPTGGICLPQCGNNICNGSETPQTCPSDCHCGNSQCEASKGENFSTCPADCTCGNGVCNVGENYSSCSADCSAGGGAASTNCGNSVCNAGETPGNCTQDCPNYSQCFVNGEWNLCCLLGGTNCNNGGSQGAAYYGVCNGSICEQRYLLTPPSSTCTTNDQCGSLDIPTSGNITTFMVKDTQQNYLKDLQPYLSKIPKNPGGNFTGSEKCNYYWVSSHPKVVKNHLFCIWQCFEARAQIWPYSDVQFTPDGDHLGDTKWSIACSF